MRKCDCRNGEACNVCWSAKRKAREGQLRKFARHVASEYMKWTGEKLTRQQVTGIEELHLLNVEIRSNLPDSIGRVIGAIELIASGRNGLAATAKKKYRTALEWKSETNPIRAGFLGWKVADFLFEVFHASLMRPYWDEYQRQHWRAESNRRNKRSEGDKLQRYVNEAYRDHPHERKFKPLCEFAAMRAGKNPRTGRPYTWRVVFNHARNPIRKNSL